MQIQSTWKLKQVKEFHSRRVEEGIEVGGLCGDYNSRDENEKVKELWDTVKLKGQRV